MKDSIHSLDKAVADNTQNMETLNETFMQLQESLEPHVLDEVMKGRVSDKLIQEYGKLADVASTLLSLLADTDFIATLDTKENIEYDTILTGFSACSSRFQDILKESIAINDQALLALVPTHSMKVN